MVKILKSLWEPALKAALERDAFSSSGLHQVGRAASWRCGTPNAEVQPNARIACVHFQMSMTDSKNRFPIASAART